MVTRNQYRLGQSEVFLVVVLLAIVVVVIVIVVRVLLCLVRVLHLLRIVRLLLLLLFYFGQGLPLLRELVGLRLLVLLCLGIKRLQTRDAARYPAFTF